MSSADKTPKHWTVQDDEDGAVVHDSLLGRGGFGEVHKVIAIPFALLTPPEDV